MKGQNSIHCGWRKGDVELGVISILMAQSPTSPDDPTQRPYVDIKQHWEDNRALRNPTIEASQGRNTHPKLYSLRMVLHEGLEPGKRQTTDSQLREPPQQDTVVDGIEDS